MNGYWECKVYTRSGRVIREEVSTLHIHELLKSLLLSNPNDYRADDPVIYCELQWREKA